MNFRQKLFTKKKNYFMSIYKNFEMEKQLKKVYRVIQVKYVLTLFELFNRASKKKIFYEEINIKRTIFILIN